MQRRRTLPLLLPEMKKVAVALYCSSTSRTWPVQHQKGQQTTQQKRTGVDVGPVVKREGNDTGLGAVVNPNTTVLDAPQRGAGNVGRHRPWRNLEGVCARAVVELAVRRRTVVLALAAPSDRVSESSMARRTYPAGEQQYPAAQEPKPAPHWPAVFWRASSLGLAAGAGAGAGAAARFWFRLPKALRAFRSDTLLRPMSLGSGIPSWAWISDGRADSEAATTGDQRMLAN